MAETLAHISYLFTHWVEVGVGIVWNYPVTFLCLFSGLYFTLIELKFVQVKAIPHALALLRGKFDNPKEKGEITHFQALSAALSGTIGLGNIAGVAIAIAMGGPGAIFWMWVIGFLGMATKFVECTLSTHFREHDPKTGEVRGGPMYYITKGLGKKWRPMALTFAIFTAIGAIGAGGMFQSNQAASALSTYFGVEAQYTGFALALMVAIVTLGGIKRIGTVASKIVPLMCGIYLLGAFLICLLNIQLLPYVLKIIFVDAFTGISVAGGVVGAVIKTGIRRAVFSNEAGLGTASIAHAAVKTDYPIREGIVASLGPLIDTIIVCTATASVIILSGLYGPEQFASFTKSGPVAASQKVRFSQAWTETLEYPKSTHKIKHYTDGEVFHYHKTQETGAFVVPTPLQKSEKKALDNGKSGSAVVTQIADGLRFSCFRGSGNYHIELKNPKTKKVISKLALSTEGDQQMIRKFMPGLTPKAKTLKNVKAFTMSPCLIGKWHSHTLKFTEAGKELIQSYGPISEVRFQAQANSDQWYVDKVEAFSGRNGIALTITAFDKYFKHFGSVFIALAGFLFAYSTMITWSYYGETSAVFVFGNKIVLPYKIFFVLVIFIGSLAKLSTVINFMDLMVGLMVIPNTIGILMLSKKVVALSEDYFERLKNKEFKRYK